MKATTIGGGLLIFCLLALAIAGITEILPHSDEKYYVALSGVATLILAAGTLLMMREQTTAARRAAGFQMMVQLDAQFSKMREVREEVALGMVGGRPPTPFWADQILDFFEMLACYVREGLLDFALVSNAFSVPVRHYWAALKSYVFEMRSTYSDGSLYEHLEWLNKKFENEYAEAVGGPVIKALADDFFRSEIVTVAVPRTTASGASGPESASRA